MLKTIAVCGALAALMINTAFAHEPHHAKASSNKLIYSTNVEIGAGYLWTADRENRGDSRLDDENFAVIEGAARASIPLAKNVSAQFDIDAFLAINERDEDDCCSGGDDYLQHFGFVSAHLTWRDRSKGAVGVLASYGEASAGNSEEAQILIVGAEAQAYLGDFTLYGQGGYMTADDESNNDVMTDAWWGRLVGRYFPNPNSRLQGELFYIDGEENASSGVQDIEAFAWGARYDHAINNGPVSLFASYRGVRTEDDHSDASKITDHKALVGVSLRLGAPTMKDEDRRGATLDTPAWAIGRAVGWTINVID